jgi:hypothetical protein
MKAGTADPEKTSTTRQRHGKHDITVMNNHATRDDSLDTVFSMRSVPRLYKDNQLEFIHHKSHKTLPGVEHGPPRLEVGEKLSSLLLTA